MNPIPTPEEIVAAVCQTTGIPFDELAGPGRHDLSVIAREVCAHALQARRYSYPVSARAMGKLNHSTLVTAVTRTTGHMDDPIEWPSGRTTRRRLLADALSVADGCAVSRCCPVVDAKPEPPPQPTTDATVPCPVCNATGQVSRKVLASVAMGTLRRHRLPVQASGSRVAGWARGDS